MIDRVIVAGGGTGGHLFPGMAVVEELRRRKPDVKVVFVGTARGIEGRVLPARGEQLELMEVRPLMGRGALDVTRNLALLPAGFARAARILALHRPDLVLGLGGYSAGPIVLAAAFRRTPTALLEQNAHVGLTNRMLAKAVGRAYLSFPETAAHFRPARARALGNPVRRAFVEAARLAAADPVGFEARARQVLVLGGSQGARALNQHVPRALAELGLDRRGIRVVHQTGPDMVSGVADRYRELGLEADVVPFIDDMARAYARALLVIGRAGATTLAELCAIGRPAILVPYPHAAEDHQRHNALALQKAGAAIVIGERELGRGALVAAFKTLMVDTTRRRRMAEAARACGQPDAAAAVVDDLVAWLGRADASYPEPSGVAACETGTTSSDELQLHASASLRRRPKVKRGTLRLRTVDSQLDATG
ncbi:MAG: undecaprenyldiphospho-muramoylpentapeptide beta-N-acetylglucosaminyltransferase [Proteobacteria bacterium]|nr:undecaprenyldiphospho-muramoylpentapeptide beta-N-acetylglucosaminyltransferase [Pseudomonadota bacterium]